MGNLVEIPRVFNPQRWYNEDKEAPLPRTIFERRHGLNPTYNLYIFSLGGTAFMEESAQGLRPAGSLETLLDELKKRKFQELEFILDSSHVPFEVRGDFGDEFRIQIVPHQICNVDSNDLSFDHLKELCNNLSLVSNDPLTLGAVTIMGTDMLTHYSRLAELFLKNPKVPIIFTGAQFNAQDSRTAFFDNLASSLFLATQDYKGVFVCFDHGRKVYVPKNLVKFSTIEENAFKNVCLRDVVLVGGGLEEAINEVATISFDSGRFNLQSRKGDLPDDGYSLDKILAGRSSGIFDPYFSDRFGRTNFLLDYHSDFWFSLSDDFGLDFAFVPSFSLTHPCFAYHDGDDIETFNASAMGNESRLQKYLIDSSIPAVIIEGTGIGNVGRRCTQILAETEISSKKLVVLVSNTQDIVDLTAYEAAAPLERGILSYSGTLADASVRLRCVLGLLPLIESGLEYQSDISSYDVAKTIFMSGVQLPRGSAYVYEEKLRIPLLQEDLLVGIPVEDAISRAVYNIQDLRRR